MSPEGEVEENIYKKANGTELGNEASDLCIYNGKVYILCNNEVTPSTGVKGDGTLIIADAKTMKKEKAFTKTELKFPTPPETNKKQEFMTISVVENIAVMDEEHIFFSDDQTLFCFNSKTGKNTILKGSYETTNKS